MNDCGTRGGVAINHSGPTYTCTSGFLVKAKTSLETTWKRYILTAGHCVNNSGGTSNSNKWFNPAGTITWGKNKAMDFYQYSCGFLCTALENDQGLINIGTTANPSKWNEYHVNSGYTTITGAVTKTNQLVGQVVCRTGRTSGSDCGTINRKPTSVDLPGYKLYGAIEVNMQSADGDSGSGFYRSWSYNGEYHRDAYGVLMGKQTISGQYYTYYYSWDTRFYASPEFCDLWNIQICTSQSCPL